MSCSGVAAFFGIAFAGWLLMLCIFGLLMGGPSVIVGHIVGLICIPFEGWLLNKFWK